MTARFRISEDDYAAAMKLFARMSPMRWALLIGMTAVLVLAVWLGGRAFRPFAIAGLVGGTGVILLSMALAPVLARRHYRKYKAIQEEFSAELLDEGLRLSAPHGGGTIVWTHVLKWRQSDRFVLIYVMPRLFHIVPKSVAAQGFDLQGLIDRLNRHVGPEA